MSDDQPQSPPRQARRSSFAGQTFADLFSGGRSSISKPSSTSKESNSPPPTQQLPGPISQAAAQAQGRRMSLTTLGLSGSPNQTSPFNTFRGRRGSIGSENSGSVDDSAIAEDEAPAAQQQNSGSGNPPTSPFARRTSFGARALRDIRSGSFTGNSGGGGPGSPGQNGTRSPPASSSSKATAPNGTISAREAKGRGASSEGFNWSDNLRNRAERSSVVAAGGGGGSPPMGSIGGNNHSRAKSVATMEPPPSAQPKPKEQKRPDHFQERILKGDFYMD